MRTFEGDDDETVVATLREQVNAQKKVKVDLTAQRDRLLGELAQHILTPEQIESIIVFARSIRGRMDNATYEQKRNVVKMLNVRVDLVHDEDCYRLSMACDLPGSNYAKVIRQTNMESQKGVAIRQTGTSPHNCVRVSATIRLPGRKQQPDYSTLADLLFASVGVPVAEEVAR